MSTPNACIGWMHYLTKAIAVSIGKHGGKVKFLVVPDDKADSDHPKKKRAKSGHGYFNYTLLMQESEDFFYQHVRKALHSIPGRRLAS